jgi:glycosyltransferase involved in cell wall biosynthesis
MYTVPPSYMQKPVYLLIRSWNSFRYLHRCIPSVLGQRGVPFTVLFVDDHSDYTQQEKQFIRRELAGHVVIFNTTRKYAIHNAYDMIHHFVSSDDAIVVNVDGDDWLSSASVLARVVSEYEKTHCLLTYGNCRYFWPGTKKHNTLGSDWGELNHRYSRDVEKNNAYRKTFFIPLHLRTWTAGLFKKIRKESFLRPDGSWQRICEDEAMFLPMLEMAGGRYSVIKDVLYVYNRENKYNDSKANAGESLFDELCIYKQQSYKPLA